LGEESLTRGTLSISIPRNPLFTQKVGIFMGYIRQPVPCEGGGSHALIMEGYMDVLMSHQHGVPCAVAPLGTALTPDQAHHLKRYTEQVIMVYDGDAAGGDASVRGAMVVLEKGLYVRLVKIPDNLDPDDFLRKNGKKGFLLLLDKGQDLLEFYLDRLGVDASSRLDHRLQQAQSALDLVARVPNEIQKSEWVKLIAQRLSLDPDALQRQLKRSRVSPKRTETSVSPPKTLVRPIEEEMLQMLIQYPELGVYVKKSQIAFDDPRCQLVMTQWKEEGDLTESSIFKKILGRFDRQTAEWLSALALEEKKFQHPLVVFEGLLESHHRRLQESHRRDLAFVVHQMLEGTLPRDDKKIGEFQKLTKSLKGSKII